MKILMVCHVFPPDKGVATLRASFMYQEMQKMYDVEVIKCGSAFDFNSSIKTLDASLIGSLPKVLINKRVLAKALSPLLLQYDVIWITAPSYGLLEIARIAQQLGKKVIADMRDLPDLILVEKTKQNKWLKLVWMLNYFLLERYILNRLGYAHLITAVGHTSASILQQKMPTHPAIFNLHNGYTDEDKQLVDSYPKASSSDESETLTILLSGSVHAFRDSRQLRAFMQSLTDLNKPVKLVHYGTLYPALKAFVENIPDLHYISVGFVERTSYLQELQKADYLLLVCADAIVWEPTTTVFDYILVDKPIIYIGMKNNEAYDILSNSGAEIIEPEQITHHQLANKRSESLSRSGREIYNRQFQLNRIKHYIQQLCTD